MSISCRYHRYIRAEVRERCYISLLSAPFLLPTWEMYTSSNSDNYRWKLSTCLPPIYVQGKVIKRLLSTPCLFCLPEQWIVGKIIIGGSYQPVYSVWRWESSAGKDGNEASAYTLLFLPTWAAKRRRNNYWWELSTCLLAFSYRWRSSTGKGDSKTNLHLAFYAYLSTEEE